MGGNGSPSPRLWRGRDQSFFKFGIVDIASKRLNSMKTYLSRFWAFYQSNPRLQKVLENSSFQYGQVSQPGY